MGKTFDKSLRCPVCGRGRVCDAGSLMKKTQTEMWQHELGEKEYDFQVRCPKCKNLIDIIINKTA